MGEPLVVVGKFTRHIDAELAKSKLAAAGLHCFVSEAQMDRIHFDWALTGTTPRSLVLVRKIDEEIARTVLHESPEDAARALSEMFEETDESGCPMCGSNELRRSGVSLLRASVVIMMVALMLGKPFFLLLIGFPVFLFRGEKACRVCGHRWKSR